MKVKVVLFVALLMFVQLLFLSSSGGRNGGWAGAPGDTGSCINCHSDTGSGNIVLNGAPSKYEAGTSYEMVLTLNDANAMVGGFQLVATDGESNTQIGTFSTPVGQKLNTTNRLVQSSPKAFASETVSWDIAWTAPNTNPPAEIVFYFAGNAANGNGSNGAGDASYVGSSAAIVLPVELSKFELERNSDNQIELAWQTELEINSDYFEIQRRLDDDTEYKSIGQVSSAGNSDWVNNYEFTDRDFINADNLYYRLKQVDFDGKFQYSKTISTKNTRTTNDFKIYPNPASKDDLLNFESFNPNDEDLEIEIFNLSGRKVVSQKTAGNTISITSLEAGVYFVTVRSKNRTLLQDRLVVQ